MKHIILVACCLLCVLCTATAQSDVSMAIKQINAIKLNPDYISGESTAETEDAAKANARAMLEVNIEEWINSQQKNVADLTGYVAKSGNSILEVKTTRGNRYRVFLYVKKSDIMTFTNTSDIIAAPFQKNNQQTVISSIPVDTLSATPDSEQYKTNVYQPSEQEKKMIAITKFDDVKPFIMQTEGIRDYGKFADLPATGECYLFVYNKSGGIAACLLRNGNVYRNVRNGNQDDINNYKGCGAIWFRYNK